MFLVYTGLIVLVAFTAVLYWAYTTPAKVGIYQPIKGNAIASPSFLVTKTYWQVWWDGPVMKLVRGVLAIIGLASIINWFF